MTKILTKGNLTSLSTMRRVVCAMAFLTASSASVFAEWTEVGTTIDSDETEVFSSEDKTKDGVSLEGKSKVKKWAKCSDEGFYYTIFKNEKNEIAYELYEHTGSTHVDTDNDGVCDKCNVAVFTAEVYHNDGTKTNVLTTADGDNISLQGNDIAYIENLDNTTALSLRMKLMSKPLPNVVINGTAALAAFYSDQALYIPKAFTATYAGLAFTPSVYADQDGGWESVVLPFDASEVYIGDEDVLQAVIASPSLAKDYKRSFITKESDGDFWVKELKESDINSVGFSNLDDHKMNAYTPYIVAVPGSSFGEYSLEGKTLAFVGRNLSVNSTENVECEKESDVFSMYSSFVAEEVENVYVLGSSNNFEFKEKVTLKPFQSYLKGASSVRSLVIYDVDDEENVPTGVNDAAAAEKFSVFSSNGDMCIMASEAGKIDIYSLDGKLLIAGKAYSAGVTNISGLNAGAYIVNGKIVIVK